MFFMSMQSVSVFSKILFYFNLTWLCWTFFLLERVITGNWPQWNSLLMRVYYWFIIEARLLIYCMKTFCLMSNVFLISAVQGEPTITKVTRVIEGDPRITKVTRVIDGQPSITTRVLQGKHHLTHPWYKALCVYLVCVCVCV